MVLFKNATLKIGLCSFFVFGIGLAAIADQFPQSPEQIEFNRHVVPGSVLMVAWLTDAKDQTLLSPFCLTITSLQTLWGNNKSGDKKCVEMSTRSKVKVLAKTNSYAIDDPSLPVEPYGNYARLIVRVSVLSVTSLGLDIFGEWWSVTPKQLIAKEGYMIIDDLTWPQ